MSSAETKHSPTQSLDSLVILPEDKTPTESEQTSSGDKSRGWRAEWDDGLPPYRPASQCGVCGFHTASTKFQRFSSPDEERKVVVLIERFERVCDRCHNTWYEGPK